MKTLLALALFCTALPAAAVPTTGNELQQQCTWASPASPTWMTGVCMGYINGYLDGFRLSYYYHYHTSKVSVEPAFCIPAGRVTVDQAVQIWMRWSRQHPDTLHQDAGVLLGLALMEAFPCKQI